MWSGFWQGRIASSTSSCPQLPSFTHWRKFVRKHRRLNFTTPALIRSKLSLMTYQYFLPQSQTISWLYLNWILNALRLISLFALINVCTPNQEWFDTTPSFPHSTPTYSGHNSNPHQVSQPDCRWFHGCVEETLWLPSFWYIGWNEPCPTWMRAESVETLRFVPSLYFHLSVGNFYSSHLVKLQAICSCYLKL